MTDTLLVLAVALLVIAAASIFGRRLGIAAPLVLVVVGVAASFLPMTAGVVIQPDWILEGVLPPLLYSAAVSMPAMNFRRELGAISGLSVVLVVLSSLVLGLFFMLVLPGLGFAWGVALGAIVSPTDAVATSIVKGTTVSKRVIALLDGESLLNDATALVVLRSAIVGVAAGFSFWGSVGTFAYSVAIAVAIGGLIGWLNLVVRRRVADPTVNTVISFAVPFIAAVPAEILGASGLVAAVVAGLVTGVRAPRLLSAQNRLSDAHNWKTVELVLESAVFLTMGIQLKSIIGAVQRAHAGVGAAVLIAFGALALTLIVRTAYVAPLLRGLALKSRRTQQMQPRLQTMHQQLSTETGRLETVKAIEARGRRRSDRDLDRFAVRVRRMLADIDYFVRAPLGWRDGAAVVWAGMRGAVTVAAAQTLPENTPQRPVLILVAFAVAAFSLLIQGGTVGPLLRRIAPRTDQTAVEQDAAAERQRIMQLLQDSAQGIEKPTTSETDDRTAQFQEARRHRLAVAAAQREALLDARATGAFDADLLESALANIDASEIAIELRSDFAGISDAG